MTAETQTQGARILVVGAGPTGLTLATTLAAFGIACTIIDRRTGTSVDSKGLALNTSSLYALELLGIRGMVGRRGQQIERVNLHWNGHRLCALKLRHLNFHLRTIVTQPQSQTERELCNGLESLGVSVTWGMKLDALQERPDGVRAVLETSDGRKSTHEFDFVVGCDGKHSRVRQHVGAAFDGHDYPMYFTLGDFELQARRNNREIDYFVFDDTFFVLVPIGEKQWRVVVKHDGAPPIDRAIDEQDILGPMQQRLGPNFVVPKPQWLSRAPFYMRLANKLRRGRMFIAGDAAHLVSPIGGTGMNMGIQDAINLGWKLAYFVLGHGSEELLGSYETERLGAIRATAAMSDQSTQLIAGKEVDGTLTKVLLPTMQNRYVWRHVLPMRHSGLGLSYANAYKTPEVHGVPVPGSRAAGEWSLGLSPPLLRTVGHDSDAPIPLMCFVVPDATEGDLWNRVGDLVDLAGQYPGVLKVVAVRIGGGQEGPISTVASGSCCVVQCDTKPDWLARIGIGLGGLMVIQPDGIIGFSGGISEVGKAMQWLGRRFHIRASRAAPASVGSG